MPNGTLKLYNKIDNTLLVSLDILGTFNIEENLNETPSNMKVKVITTDTYREEFEVNTVAFHEDTNTWWVIKSDESTYLHTGEYEHEIQLVELLEFYSFRHLPNCAFAPNTYTLEQMLNRLFNIAKLSVTVNYPSFLDKNKIMPFMSFENFTVANAIKNISRSINAIPKMFFDYPFVKQNVILSIGMSPPSSPDFNWHWLRVDTNQLYVWTGFTWFFIAVAQTGTTLPVVNQPFVYFVNTATVELFISQVGQGVLTFVNRNGLDLPIVETLNTQFPIAYEKNTNSSDQFLTRSVSNITNAKSSFLTISPKQGGFKSITPNSFSYDINNAKVFLPSKIDKIDFVRVYCPIQLVTLSNNVETVIYTGYYIDKETYQNALINHNFGTPPYTTAQKTAMANNLPDPIEFQEVNYNDDVDKTYEPSTSGFTDPLFFKKMSLLSKFEFDTVNKLSGGVNVGDQDKKDRTIHWLPNTNEMIMPLSFRNALRPINAEDHNLKYRIFNDGTFEVFIRPKYENLFYLPFPDIGVAGVPNDEILIQVGYFPISDIKLTIDNDNDAQDEKFFNQSGKVIDAVSVSRLITSHTNDSVEGTKIRNAKYESLENILPVGQLVRDSNQIYVITQRSIDGQTKNGNEYYNVLYTLSRNRIARSENIIADSSVISYKTPDDNLVFRRQLYKDYLELSLTNVVQKDTPYLDWFKMLKLDTGLGIAGTNFDFTSIAKNDYGLLPTTIRYIRNPIVFDLHKSKLVNVDYQDNNVVGLRLDVTNTGYVQTPIVYTDNVGRATNFELIFIDTEQLKFAVDDYNSPIIIDPLVPFTDLTNVPQSFYDNDVVNDVRYSVKINEPTYQKDSFEIPVFEYMLQGNDNYDPKGNVVISNDLFSTFTGNIRYHYIINNSTRFTAENADSLRGGITWSSSNQVVVLTRTNATQISLVLYSSFPTLNSNAISNIGIYAIDTNTNAVKFLFAINDYTLSNTSNIILYLNNWKI